MLGEGLVSVRVCLVALSALVCEVSAALASLGNWVGDCGSGRSCGFFLTVEQSGEAKRSLGFRTGVALPL